jgi:hypothetical protein
MEDAVGDATTVDSWEFYETITICLGQCLVTRASEALRDAVAELDAHGSTEQGLIYALGALGVVVTGGKRRDG